MVLLSKPSFKCNAIENVHTRCPEVIYPLNHGRLTDCLHLILKVQMNSKALIWKVQNSKEIFKGFEVEL